MVHESDGKNTLKAGKKQPVNHRICSKIKRVDLTVVPIFHSMHSSLEYSCSSLLTALFLRHFCFMVFSHGSAVVFTLLAVGTDSSCFCPGSPWCISKRDTGVCNKASDGTVYWNCR